MAKCLAVRLRRARWSRRSHRLMHGRKDLSRWAVKCATWMMLSIASRAQTSAHLIMQSGDIECPYSRTKPEEAA